MTVNDNDFVSLDVNQLSKPRLSDGSLPDVTFLKLVETSDLIDVGLPVGLPYYGMAPDLGAWEYLGQGGDLNQLPSINILEPSDGDVFLAPANINISATASDADA